MLSISLAKGLQATRRPEDGSLNIVLFHLRAMLGLICLQAGILVGFALKYL
jgi:hypothetical protein